MNRKISDFPRNCVIILKNKGFSLNEISKELIMYQHKILNYKILIILCLEFMRINFISVNKKFNNFNKQIILFIK